MKPRFSLDLSNESVALLERSGDGWVKIAEISLEAPTLDDDLAGLRRLMEAQAPEGFATKLILPNTQILYAEIDAPGPSRSARRIQIKEALEGRTPYPPSELAFDWSQGGERVKVAVVALETLAEAEQFADANGFRPVAFVAAPQAGRFGGEPFFGLTANAADYMPAGASLDRDQDPARVTATSLIPYPPEGAAAEAVRVEPAGPILPDPVAVDEPGIPAPDEAEADEAESDEVESDEVESDEVESEGAGAEWAAADEPVASAGLEAGTDDGAGEEPRAAAPDIPADEATETALFTLGTIPDPREIDHAAPAEPAASAPDTEAAAEDFEHFRDNSAGDGPENLTIETFAAGTVEFVSTDDPGPSAAEPVAEPAPRAAEPEAAKPQPVEPQPVTETLAGTDADAGVGGPEFPDEAPFVAIEDDEDDQVDPGLLATIAAASAGAAGAAGRQAAGKADSPTDHSPGALDGPDSKDPKEVLSRIERAVRQARQNPEADGRRGDAPGFHSRRSAGSADPQGAADQTGGRLAAVRARIGAQPPRSKDAGHAAGRFGGIDAPAATAAPTTAGHVPPHRIAQGAAIARSRLTLPAIAGALALGAGVLWWVFAGGGDEPQAVGAAATGAATGTMQTAGTGQVDGQAGDIAPQDLATETAGLAPDAAADTAADTAAAGGAANGDAAAGAADPAAEATAPLADPISDVPPEVAAQPPEATAAPAADAETDIGAVARGEPLAPAELTALANEAAAAAADPAPSAQTLPLAPADMPELGLDGQIIPTPEGVLTPDGFRLVAGKPPIVPPARPQGLGERAAEAAEAADPLFQIKPRPRPATLHVAPTPAAAPAAPAPEGAAPAASGQSGDASGTNAAPLPPADPALASVKPRARPAAVERAALAAEAAEAALADAAASAALAEAEAAARGNNPSTSPVPRARPAAILELASAANAAAPAVPDINVDDALSAAALAAPEPEPAPAPAPAAAPAPTSATSATEPKVVTQDGIPTRPTTRLVEKKSTLANAIDLGDVNLIGVYGSPRNRRALVRMPNGRFLKVQIGDRFDGGQVAAIGESELTYVKGGRTYVLRMLRGS